jgi:release factor glutamine methyltransferase
VPDRPAPTVRQLVDAAAQVLAAAGVVSARVDATAMATHVLGRPLVLAPDAPPADFQATYAGLVERRRLREPLQHVLGETGFRHLTLLVEPGVFVPRPETEIVAQQAVDEARRLGRPAVVVDLCCGTGAIGLSVADEVPDAVVVAVDVSPAAVQLAGVNRDRCGLSDRVEVVQADVRDPELLAARAGTVDVVVSNPPYIPPDQEPTEPEVRDHDPDLALYGGGADGLALPEVVVAAALRLLCPGGLLVMEHAEVQDEQVRELVGATGGFVQARTVDDLTGRPRMVWARRR